MDNNQKKRVAIKIMGDEYTIRGSSSPDHMEKAAAYVDSIMKNISDGNPQMSKHMVAVLSAINLADEVFRLREELKKRSSLQQLQIEHEDKPGEGSEERAD